MESVEMGEVKSEKSVACSLELNISNSQTIICLFSSFFFEKEINMLFLSTLCPNFRFFFVFVRIVQVTPTM